MILGFMQHFDKAKKEPTYFREKILAGVGMVRWQLNDQWYITDLNKVNAEAKYNGEESNLKPDHKPKLHTLRADPHDRWKAGRKVEMVYRGAGYKILSHFNKGIPELEKCVSVQAIEIMTSIYAPNKIRTSCRAFVHKSGKIWVVRIWVDGKEQGPDEVDKIIVNDGFKNVEEFSKWFGRAVWKGKIIHWTNLRY